MSPAADIPLAVVGCDFRVASSAYRSRLVLGVEEAIQIAHLLRRSEAADGFLELSTCNRNEWIVSSADPRWSAELLRSQMMQRAGTDASSWIQPYVHTGDDAARHVFRVAIGQESLVVGERQIAGQLYRALEVARERGTSSRILNGLGTVAGRLVRIALRRGCIENAAVGVHSLAVTFLNRALDPKRRAQVAVVGTGRIGRRVLGLLTDQHHFDLLRCNRTVCAEDGDGVRPMTEIDGVLANVDAAIVATGAGTPVVRAEHLASRAGGSPLLIVDIGIPEQVERSGLPADVRVVGLDELTDYYRCELAPGRGAEDPGEAERLVERAISEYRAFCNERAFSGILDTVQRHHRQLVGEEIPRLIAERFSYLPDESRGRLEEDLRNIVLEYTSEVFRTIKEASRRETEEEPCPEP